MGLGMTVIIFATPNVDAPVAIIITQHVSWFPCNQNLANNTEIEIRGLRND